jgi:hypothetical protein
MALDDVACTVMKKVFTNVEEKVGMVWEVIAW